MNVNSVTLIMLLSVGLTSVSIMINQSTYGQGLDKTYDNQKCGLSIQHPSDWQIEEIQDSPGVTNYVVELQPMLEDGFNNVVGVEINDISSLSDKSFEGIKDFEEESLSLDEEAGLLTKETSEPTQLAGFPAQKIIYQEVVSGDKKMDVFTVAFDREYKLTYDTNSGYYDKHLPIFEEMIKTFKITQPSFEGIIC